MVNGNVMCFLVVVYNNNNQTAQNLLLECIIHILTRQIKCFECIIHKARQNQKFKCPKHNNLK
jgi:hypothetical protein